MPLHLTKIAHGEESPATLKAWLESQGDAGEARLTTRYLPKRAGEMAGGSLYWIHSHLLVGRSPLIGFEQRPDGRYWIRLEPRLVAVRPSPKRAHQGWRYLADQDVPPDMEGEASGVDAMPAAMLKDLMRLGLV